MAQNEKWLQVVRGLAENAKYYIYNLLSAAIKKVPNAKEVFKDGIDRT